MGYLLLTTGMRASELLSLQFSHVHETPSMYYIEFKGKREKWRRIPLSKKTFHMIEYLKKIMQMENINNPYICFNKNLMVGSISYEALRLIARSASMKLTSQSNSPHWFRRSFITKLLAEGIPLYEVMKISGHTSISTTNNYLKDIKENKLSILPYD